MTAITVAEHRRVGGLCHEGLGTKKEKVSVLQLVVDSSWD